VANTGTADGSSGRAAGRKTAVLRRNALRRAPTLKQAGIDKNLSSNLETPPISKQFPNKYSVLISKRGRAYAFPS
jgi:hypothetical protein